MFDTLYCCGTCVFSKYCGEIHDFICSNENSENYGLNVAYTDRCDEQEEKYTIKTIGNQFDLK